MGSLLSNVFVCIFFCLVCCSGASAKSSPFIKVLVDQNYSYNRIPFGMGHSSAPERLRFVRIHAVISTKRLRAWRLPLTSEPHHQGASAGHAVCSSKVFATASHVPVMYTATSAVEADRTGGSAFLCPAQRSVWAKRMVRSGWLPGG